VMDLCLSCKACKSECPSNVDMARLKAEWQQHLHDARGVPWRTRLVAGSAAALRLATVAPWAYNLAVTAPVVSGLVKRALGFAPARSLPPVHGTTLRRWYARRASPAAPAGRPRVHLFCDEFTDTLDVPIGVKTVELLEGLGYEVIVPEHVDSGRAQLSKGLVREARDLATRNVELLESIVTDDAPLVGVEPSALLGFRDEYPDLVPERLAAAARRLAARTLLVDEFLAREAAAGRIGAHQFTAPRDGPSAGAPRRILVHGHCHQKALATLAPTVAALGLVPGHVVETIPSGCCGMAGSFGYEREHHALSMAIGELVLLPAVRAAADDALIAAAGTSCRHQIKDGTGRRALHPVEILHAQLR